MNASTTLPVRPTSVSTHGRKAKTEEYNVLVENQNRKFSPWKSRSRGGRGGFQQRDLRAGGDKSLERKRRPAYNPRLPKTERRHSAAIAAKRRNAPEVFREFSNAT